MASPDLKTTAANVSPEQPQRTRAVKPKSAAATHKHTNKKSTQHAEPATPAVPAISREEVARLAYSYWEARGYRGGSQEEDWLRAERELFVLAQNR